MVSDKDKCFRLRGIPKDYGERQIQEILAEELFPYGNVDIEVHSLACNPVREKEWIATLSFAEIPVSLARQPEYFIKIPNSRRRLHLDTHFEGFTPLHATPDEECTFDVVAISGLNGHAFGSFKQAGSGHMWLRDDLPLDFQQARIFIYGYDTSPEHQAFQNIFDIADTFRKGLATLRRTSHQIPLVFVAHSLGGIIVKAALNAMVDSQNDQDKLNLLSLWALFFFGVPHEGMNIESFIAMNPDTINRRIIYPLDSQNSAELRVISERFTRSFKDTVMVNFYETLKSSTAERQADGSWSMSGPEEILVSTNSATQGRVFDDGDHSVFQVQRTHSNMVKLSGVHDHVYEHIRHRLAGVIDKLGNRNIARMPLPSAEDKKACLRSLWFAEQNDRQVQATDPTGGTCSWIFENPKFKQWHESRSNLLWILGPPGAGKSTLMKYILQWKNSQPRDKEVVVAFFVHGRGKSELQHTVLGLYRALLHQLLQSFPSHLTTLARTYRHNEDSRGEYGISWAWSEQELSRSFFNILTKETPKHPITVLVDALDEVASSLTDSVSTPAEDLIAKLKNFAKTHSPEIAGGRLNILVSSRYYPMMYDNSSLCIRIEKENEQDINTLIKIHPTLNDIRGEDESLQEIIAKRADGIIQWVSVVLKEVTRLHNKGNSFSTIRKAVERVPEGLQDLYKSLILSGDFCERRQALKLFTWLIFAARPLSLAEFRDALAVDAGMEYTSFTRLSESEDFFDLTAMENVVIGISRGLVQVQKSDRAKNSVFAAGFFRSKDTRLDDPLYDGGWHTLQLMHQSVLDYLKFEGLDQLAASIQKTSFNAHWELSRSCIKYLLLEEVVDQSFNSRKSACIREMEVSLTFELALTEYAHSFWLLHVMKVEEENVDQQDLLQIFALKGRDGYLPQSCNLRLNELGSPFLSLKSTIHVVFGAYRTLVQQVDNLYQFWNDRFPAIIMDLTDALVRHPFRLTLLEVLLIAGIRIAVPYMQKLELSSFEWDSSAYLLQYALLGRHQEAIDWTLNNLSRDSLQRLLDSKPDCTRYSPLAIATIQGDPELVQQLLDAGAKVDARSGDRQGSIGYSALGLAAQQGNSAVVEILLKAGADRMEQTTFDKNDNWDIGTPHFAAAALGHDGVVQLLLEQSYQESSVRQVASMRNREGFTLLHLCHTEAVIKALLDHGADPNAKDNDGKTPLHEHFRSLELVRLLLDRGSDPRWRDKPGESPLLYAAKNCTTTLSVLFNWTDLFLRTIPMLLIRRFRERGKKRADIVEQVKFFILDPQALLNHDWNTQDHKGCTLVAVAVMENIPEIVDILLDSGKVDPRIVDNEGIAPLGKATSYGYHAVTEILKRYLDMNPVPCLNEGNSESASLNSCSDISLVVNLGQKPTSPASKNEPTSVPSTRESRVNEVIIPVSSSRRERIYLSSISEIDPALSSRADSEEEVTSTVNREMTPVQGSRERWTREAHPVSNLREEHNSHALRSGRRQKKKRSPRRGRDQQARERAKPEQQPRHQKTPQNHSCCII